MSGSATVTAGKVFNNESITDAKLNALGLPTVQVDAGAITDRELQLAGLLTKLAGYLVNPNLLLNGNLDKPDWNDLGPTSCPAAARTQLARSWAVAPSGGALTGEASATTPDAQTAYALKLTGAAAVTEVDVGQDLPAWISAVARRTVVFSAYVYNGTGASLVPTLRISTADAYDDFSAVTFRSTSTLTTCPSAAWTRVQVSLDASALTNAGNGLRLEIRIPAGGLNAGTKTVAFAKLKLEPGTAATEFWYQGLDRDLWERQGGGKIGVASVTLSTGTTTLTAGTSKRVQRLSGSLSGAAIVVLATSGAWEGAEFLLQLNGPVTTGVNTLSIRTGASTDLIVLDAGTARGWIRCVYDGSAWFLAAKEITFDE